MEFLTWKMLVIALHKQYAFERLNIKIGALYCPLHLHKWENSWCLCIVWRDCEELGIFKKFWLLIYIFGIFKVFHPLLVCQQGTKFFIISATCQEFLQIDKLVRILHIIIGNTLFYQKLQRKFCSTPLFQCHQHEARKFFHWFHPFLDILYIFYTNSFLQHRIRHNLHQDLLCALLHVRHLILRNIFWHSTRKSWLEIYSLDTSTAELSSFSLSWMCDWTTVIMDCMCHKYISLISFSKNVFDHLWWFGLRQKQWFQSWKHVNHSANAWTYWQPSCVTVGKIFLLFSVHKITVLFQLFSLYSVGVEVLVDFIDDTFIVNL